MTRLDIISDVVCPWCYLGAANHLKAMADRGASPFAIRWRAYQLDPSIPAEGLERTAYMLAKFGEQGRIDAAHERLAEMGRTVGLAFRFDRIRRAPNSLDAHRLIRWAEADSLQTRTAMAIFQAYFEEGQDISDPEVLLAIARAIGLDVSAIDRLLGGDTDRAEVSAEAEAAREMGVTGVPTFLIGGRYAVSGAQPPDFWHRVADDIDAAAEAGGG